MVTIGSAAKITGPVLSAQYVRALRDWPFIPLLEQTYGLPRMCLFAVGSRETNLNDEVGDGGHGHGVWQLDDRSHAIPPGFLGNVHTQAATAASMLRALMSQFSPSEGGVRCAFAAYNAGASTVTYNLSHGINIDTGTAGGDYSADTYARMVYLQEAFPVTAPTITKADILALLADAEVRAALVEALAGVRVLVTGLEAWDHKTYATIESFVEGLPGYVPLADRPKK